MFKRNDGYWCEKIKGKYLYAKSKKELKEKIAAYEKRITSPMTVSELLDEWLVYKEPLVQYKTLEGYQAPVKKLKEAFGDIPINELTPVMIQSFINDLGKKGYKLSTVQRPKDVLSMAYDYAITTPGERAKTNPTVGVRLPKGLEQGHRELVARESVQIIIDNVDAPFGLYPYLLMFTGLRPNELLAIDDKDIKGTHISVTKNVSWQTNKPVIKPPKNKYSIRDVEMLPQVTAVLPKFKGYLFSADGGKTPLTQTQFRRRWNKYKKITGLTDVVPYQMRHEFSTMCYDAGMLTTDTADLMGHANDDTTKNWYTHISKTRRHSSFEKLKDYTNGVKQGV